MKNLVFVLLSLIACRAEAKLPNNFTVQIAVVGEAASSADVSAACELVTARLKRDIRKDVPTRCVQDLRLTYDRPDLSTLDAFWNGSWFSYYHNLFRRERREAGIIRAVLVPPLLDKNTKFYGGMSIGNRNGIIVLNAEAGNVLRNALVLGHELGHQIRLTL